MDAESLRRAADAWAVKPDRKPDYFTRTVHTHGDLHGFIQLASSASMHWNPGAEPRPLDFVKEELSNNLPFILSLLQSVHAIETVATLLNFWWVPRELRVRALTHHLEWRAQFHVQPRHQTRDHSDTEKKWFRAVEDGDLPTCIRMVREGFDIHSRKYATGKNALGLCNRYAPRELIATFLRRQGAYLDVEDGVFDRGYSRVIENGDIEMLMLYRQLGVHHRDFWRDVDPLKLAAHAGELEMCKWLCYFGADPLEMREDCGAGYYTLSQYVDSDDVREYLDRHDIREVLLLFVCAEKKKKCLLPSDLVRCLDLYL